MHVLLIFPCCGKSGTLIACIIIAPNCIGLNQEEDKMKQKLQIPLLILLSVVLSFATGCLFKNGSNPVDSGAISQAEQAAQQLSNPVNPQVLASRYVKPTTTKKYTFSKAGHKVGHCFRKSVKRLAGSLRLSLFGASNTDNIFITLEKLKVKPVNGPKIKVDISERKVDLLSATDLSEVLADSQIPEGEYRYMEFYVKKAEIVVDGKTHNMLVPARKVRFFGKFEIKEGYTTNLAVKFMHRIIKFRFFKTFYIFIPIVRISSDLILKPVDPQITDGDIDGWAESFVDKSKLAGINVSLDGTPFVAVTDANGAFKFEKVPAGVYSLKASHPEFVNNTFSVEVAAGQIASVGVELNPSVIRSNMKNTGWFSEVYPLADANGTYGEVSLETPIEIDFVSLGFKKAELKFSGEYHASGAGRFQTFLAAKQQVSADTDMGDWWVGWSASLGTLLGEYHATNPATEYTIDVTEAIRNNPASAYYIAAKNMDLVDIRLTNVQLSIYYE